MKILIFSGHYLPGFKGGGPIKTIRCLVDSTGIDGIVYKVVTSDRDLGDRIAYSGVSIGSWNLVGNIEVFYVSKGIVGALQILRTLKVRDYDLIYINSFFSFRYSIFPALFARALNQKIVLAPRGEFSRGALQLKRLKKTIYILLYKFLRMHRNVVFQASSQYEASDIKFVFDSDTDVQIAENIGSHEFATRKSSRNRSCIRIIFVSRITPKKNLLQAIQILARVKAPVNYDVYGPIEDYEYWQRCESAIKELPAHISVNYKGSLSPDDIIDTMSKYDMFFLPTLGENYGHVIAEAFCAGIPVLISDTTPWRQLKEKEIGWDLPLFDNEQFRQTIDDFASLTDEEYQNKKKKVLDWAKNKFSQSDAVEANISMFKYALEKKRK